MLRRTYAAGMVALGLAAAACGDGAPAPPSPDGSVPATGDAGTPPPEAAPTRVEFVDVTDAAGIEFV
ncbi:MAG: hypothetical protein OXH04_11740, partial [Acidobacteria bacterium]|nr:hypothetical protein [Acidobacteriota bacterium]